MAPAPSSGKHLGRGKAYPGQIIGYRRDGRPIRLAAGGAGPAIVQTAEASGSIVSPANIVLSDATTAGNCLVVIVAFYGSSSAASVSGAGVGLTGFLDSFTQVFDEPGTANSERVEFYVDLDCSGGGTEVSVTFSGGTGTKDTAIYVLEISGVATAGALDLTKGTTGSGSSPSSGTSATSAQASEIVIAAVSAFASSTITLTGPSGAWTNLTQLTSGTSLGLLVGYQVPTSTGTYSYTATSSPASSYAAALISLKGAAAVVSSPYAPTRPGLTWKRRFQPESEHMPPKQPSQPVTCQGSIAMAPMALTGTVSASAPSGRFVAAIQAGRSWLRRFQPESLHLPPRQPSQPVTVAGSVAMAPMALQASAAQSQPVRPQKGGLTWTRRFQPESLRLPPKQPSQRVTVSGSLAMAPMAIAATAAQSQPVPRQRAGLTWVRRFQPESLRIPPRQPSQPVVVSGAMAMAPMATSGAAVEIQPVPAQRPGLTWRRRFRLGRMATPQPSQPVTAIGSVALAPMVLSAAASQSQPVPPQKPGLTWGRRFRLGRQQVPQPSQPVTVSGSIALAPMALSAHGAESYPIPPQRPGSTWRRLHHFGRQAPPQPSQPVVAAGSIAMAPMAIAVSSAQTQPVPVQRPGLIWRRFHRLGRQPPPQPSQPVTVSGSVAMAPMALAASAAPSYPIPVQRPGLAWRRQYRLGRIAVPQPSQPVVVTGSITLAPMAVRGSEAQSQPVPRQRPGLTWRRLYRSGRQQPLQPSQPITSSGSLAMAPMALFGLGAEGAPQALPPKPVQPGRAWLRQFRRHQVVVSPVGRVNSTGSLAMTPMGLSGQSAESYPVPAQRPGQTWRRVFRSGRMALRQPSQPVIAVGSVSLPPMGISGTAAPSYPVPSQRPGLTWRRAHHLGRQITRQPSQPVTANGSMAMAPMALATGTSQSQPIPPQRPGLTWIRRFQRELLHVYPRQSSQAITASGSLALGPMSLSGTSAQSPPVPSQRPGRVWRRRFHFGRQVPRQPSQPVTASGSVALAPMAISSHATEPVYTLAPQRGGLTWRRRFRSGRMAGPLPPLAVIARGSLAMAPMGLPSASPTRSLIPLSGLARRGVAPTASGARWRVSRRRASLSAARWLWPRWASAP